MSTSPQDPNPYGATPPPPPPPWPATTPPPAAPVPPTGPTYAADPSAGAGYQQVPPAYPPQGYAPTAAPGQTPLNPAESRQFAMFGHLGGIILGFLGPLIVMLVWGPRDAFTKDQATEALNFQITLVIGYIAATILSFILPIPLGIVVWIAGLVFAILGGLEANKGVAYRYPFALRLVK
jgi:uncharacterized Tic20 family protein